MSAGIVLAGFFIGMLVGLTGMGGGSLTTPILILFAGVRPLVAVGTDLVYSSVTKWVGAVAHHRKGRVDLSMVRRLAIGSVPGSLAGVWTLRLLGENGGVDAFVTRALGGTLVLVGVMIFFAARGWIRRREDARSLEDRPVAVVALGMSVGYVLGITSVGSGTIIMAAMLVFSRRPVASLVGVDVFHGAVLVTAAAVAHAGIGTVDWGIALSLMAGSVPGVLIGTRLVPVVPERFLKPALAALVVVVGVRLLG